MNMRTRVVRAWEPATRPLYLIYVTVHEPKDILLSMENTEKWNSQSQDVVGVAAFL